MPINPIYGLTMGGRFNVYFKSGKGDKQNLGGVGRGGNAEIKEGDEKTWMKLMNAGKMTGRGRGGLRV